MFGIGKKSAPQLPPQGYVEQAEPKEGFNPFNHPIKFLVLVYVSVLAIHHQNGNLDMKNLPGSELVAPLQNSVEEAAKKINFDF